MSCLRPSTDVRSETVSVCQLDSLHDAASEQSTMRLPDSGLVHHESSRHAGLLDILAGPQPVFSSSQSANTDEIQLEALSQGQESASERLTNSSRTANVTEL